MTNRPYFPRFPDDWASTRETLHAYAHAMSAISRAAAPHHPRWWHASLNVRLEGLVTDFVPIPSGGSLAVTMNLNDDVIMLETSSGAERSFSMADGMTGTEMGDALIAAAADVGLDVPIDRQRYVNDADAPYAPQSAARFLEIATNATSTLLRHRSQVGLSVGPVQLWPHGFDISFEWFGTRTVEHEENGETTASPSQINFGLYPGNEPYFYSNPWPFEADRLLGCELTAGATWQTDGWEGSMLPYSAVADVTGGNEVVASYYARVTALAQPTL